MYNYGVNWLNSIRNLEPPQSPELETLMRKQGLAFNAKLVRTMLVVSVLANIAFIAVDLTVNEAGWVRIVLPLLRFGLAGFSFWCWRYITRNPDEKNLTRISALWLFVFITVTWMIDASRPADYYWNVILHPLAALLMYYAAPFKLRGRTTAALAFTILIVANLLLRRNPLPFPENFIVLAAFLAVHPIGILHSAGLNALRRRDMEAYLSLQQQYETLKQLVTTDSLTGLPNRQYFLDQGQVEFERSTRYKRPLSLILIDIDNFAKTNDMYGYLAGDEALKTLSNILLTQKRSTDLAARIDGEEFAILCPETERLHAFRLAERIRRTIIATTITWESKDFTITVSQGAVDCQAGDADLLGMLQRAESNIYKAKLLGRNKVMIGDTVPLTSKQMPGDLPEWLRKG